jgi:hypothetical protein
MLAQIFATVFVAGFVGLAALGHVLVVAALLPKPARRLRLQTQS